ncbi:galactose mutarotase-like domain-containing protein [Aspergillus insuetus]
MHVKYASWRTTGQGAVLDVTVRVTPMILEWACNARLSFTLTPESMEIKTTGSFSGAHPEFVPRIGFNLSLPKAYDRQRNLTNYEWPQGNGSRTDVLSAQLHSSQNSVDDIPILEARMEQPFSFSLKKYTIAGLDRANPHELVEAEENLRTLDFAQHGLGTGSCGPPLFEPHRLRAGALSLRLIGRSVNFKEHDES